MCTLPSHQRKAHNEGQASRRDNAILARESDAREVHDIHQPFTEGSAIGSSTRRLCIWALTTALLRANPEKIVSSSIDTLRSTLHNAGNNKTAPLGATTPKQKAVATCVSMLVVKIEGNERIY